LRFAPFTGGTLSYIDFNGTKKFVDLATSSRPNTARASRRRNCWKRWRQGETFYRPLPAEEAGGGVSFARYESARDDLLTSW